jgi:hypothetical protein
MRLRSGYHGEDLIDVGSDDLLQALLARSSPHERVAAGQDLGDQTTIAGNDEADEIPDGNGIQLANVVNFDDTPMRSCRPAAGAPFRIGGRMRAPGGGMIDELLSQRVGYFAGESFAAGLDAIFSLGLLEYCAEAKAGLDQGICVVHIVLSL